MAEEHEVVISAPAFAGNKTLFPALSQAQLALDDFKDALRKWPIWLTLAYQDIKLRYLRSVLGPFWITLSMAITVYSMGFLYAHLFRMDVQYYYPLLVAGMLTWTLISTSVTELTETFITAQGLINQIKLPYCLYLHRVIMRNIIIFFHNILVMVPIYFIFPTCAKISFYSLLLMPDLALIYLIALIYGVVLALLGSRYRDISQIIKSLIQVVFFLTPIMWSAQILPAHYQFFIYLNPFYSLVELIRAPLLGSAPTLLNLGVTLALTLVGMLMSTWLFIRYRARIIYWL